MNNQINKWLSNQKRYANFEKWMEKNMENKEMTIEKAFNILISKGITPEQYRKLLEQHNKKENNEH